MKKYATAKKVLAFSSVAALLGVAAADTAQAHGMNGQGTGPNTQIQTQMREHMQEHSPQNSDGIRPHFSEEEWQQRQQENGWPGHHHGRSNGPQAHHFWGEGQMMGGLYNNWRDRHAQGWVNGPDQEHMHDQSGQLPEGIQPAENPTYAIGDQVILRDGHMSGMEGAEATIVGAFDTIAYEVTYNPINGADPVENHRWVVQEEIQDSGEEALEVGTEVILEAHHMMGMYSATAIIEAVEETTVYMVDYQPTDSETIIRNHKWFTEAELELVEAE